MYIFSYSFCSNLIFIIIYHENAAETIFKGGNYLRYVLDAEGSPQIILPVPNLERAY